MAFIDRQAGEVTLSIVYEGPALAGKSTCLRHLHATTPPAARGALVLDASETARALSVTLTPAWLGPVDDLTVRLKLSTVPGPVFYESSHKRILEDVDGVVFVADAQEFRQEANFDCLLRLAVNLRERGLRIRQIPMVLQYSKQDLEQEVLSVRELDDVLNPWGCPSFRTQAHRGTGVVEPLRACVTQVLERRRGPYRAMERS